MQQRANVLYAVDEFESGVGRAVLNIVYVSVKPVARWVESSETGVLRTHEAMVAVDRRKLCRSACLACTVDPPEVLGTGASEKGTIQT